MKALTYIEHGKFALMDKPIPEILDPRDAIVRVTLGRICTSDIHIKHGSVPRAVPSITVSHEMASKTNLFTEKTQTARPATEEKHRIGSVNYHPILCFRFDQHGYTVISFCRLL